MFKITGIRLVKRPEFTDIYHDAYGKFVKEVPAEVDATFYDLDVVSNDTAQVFEAEVRNTTGSLHIGWSDEFNDFLVGNLCSEKDYDAISLLIHETHLARNRGFPI